MIKNNKQKLLILVFMSLLLIVPLILSSVNFEPNSIRSEFMNNGTGGTQSFNYGQFTGQLFEINTTGNGDVKRDIFLQGVAIYAFSNNAACDGALINATIWDTSNGEPTSIKVSNDTFHGGDLSNAGYQWINISMPSTILRNNTQYAFVVLTNSTTSECRVNLTNQDPYQNGNKITSNDFGSSFSDTVSEDMHFYIYGNTTNPPSSDITVTLEQPQNGFATSSSSQDFICSAVEETTPVALNISNVSFFLWDGADAISVQTDRDLTADNSTTANETFSVSSITDDNYVWNCLYTNNNSIAKFAESNFTFTVDGTSPTVNIEFPSIDELFSTTQVSLNYTANDTNIGSCVYSLDSGVTNNSLASCDNATITANPGDNILDLFVNDTVGNSVRNQTNFTVVNSSVVDLNELELEFESSLFTLFVQNGSSSLITADFFYNESSLGTSVTTSNGTGIFINTTVTTPMVNDTSDRYINQSYFWNLTFQLDGVNTTITTDIFNQTVYQKYLGNCEDGVTTTLTSNYSAFDEELLTLLSVNYSHIYSPLGSSGEGLRSYNFTDKTNTSSDVCIFPSWGNFTADTRIEYGFNGTYDIRNFVFDARRYDNNTENVTLLLLKAATSVDVIINVNDQNDNTLEGYTVEAHKFDTASNTYDLVETGITDFSGKLIMRLDNSKTYRFIISLDGVEKLRKDNIQIIGTSPELFFVVPIGIETPIVVIDDSQQLIYDFFFNRTGVDNAVNFTWNDTGNLFSQYCLTIRNNTIRNSAEITNQCRTSNNNRIGFDFTNYFNSSYIATAYVTSATDGTRVNLEILEIDLRQPDRLRFAGGDEIVNDNLFFSFLVVATLGGIGLTTGNPVIAVILTVVGVAVVFFMKMTLLTSAAIMALVALGGIVAYALKS